MDSRLSILNMKKLDTKGPLKAFVDLSIGPILIKGWRVVVLDGGKTFVSPPQTVVKGENGEKDKYFPIVKIDSKELNDEIERYVLSVYKGNAQAQAPSVKQQEPKQATGSYSEPTPNQSDYNGVPF